MALVTLGWIFPDFGIIAWAAKYAKSKNLDVPETEPIPENGPSSIMYIPEVSLLQAAVDAAKSNTGIESLGCRFINHVEVLWVWDSDWNEKYKPTEDALKRAAEELGLGEAVYMDDYAVVVNKPGIL